MSNLSILHSGNVGDILFSIPAALGLLNEYKFDKIKYFLKLNTPISGYSGVHPLGNILLNVDYANRLIPLLERQDYIESCKIYNNDTINIDFDNFRKLNINFQTNYIPRWYFWMTGVDYDLSKPWIFADYDDQFKDCVIVSRNKRLFNKNINYKFMNKFKNIIFTGVEDEWEWFKNDCPDCKDFIKFDDFLKMANAFNSCKFFVGNQGMPYTLAESMKINRLLESNTFAPNNIPFTPNGKDAIYQEAFEKWFNRMYE